MRELAIERQASCSDDRGMGTNWISRLARAFVKFFSWQAPNSFTDYTDRDAERMRRELDLIRLRFPDHA